MSGFSLGFRIIRLEMNACDVLSACVVRAGALIFRTPGDVWMAVHHRTGDYYALKKSTQPFRGTRDQKKFLREVRAMRTIAALVAQHDGGHPNIVR